MIMRSYLGIGGVFLALSLMSCEGKREKVVAVFDNGAPREAVWVQKDGQEVGFRTWHGNGIVATETQWENGKPHGSYKRWGADGVLYEQGEWAQGLKTGTWITWYARAKIKCQGDYLAGKKVGLWKGFHPTGEVAWEQNYRNDSAVGVGRSYDVKGHLVQENYCHPYVEDGYTAQWNAAGQMVHYSECRNGNLHGFWMETYHRGAMRQMGYYSHGVRDSLWKLFRADGALWKMENWHQGVRHGEWIWLGKKMDTVARESFENGTGVFGEPCYAHQAVSKTFCAETTWVHGKIHGTVQRLAENQRYWHKEYWNQGNLTLSEDYRVDSLGQIQELAAQGQWEKGRRHGIWRNWYSHGGIKDSLHYKNGEFYGDQFHYDSQGHLYMKKNTRGRMFPVIVETLDPQGVDQTLQMERDLRSFTKSSTD